MATYGDNYDGPEPYDYEAEEKKQEAARLAEGFQLLQQDQMVKYINKKFKKKNTKYSKRLQQDGITPEMLSRLYAEDPALYDQAMDTSFKAFNKTIKSAARRRGGPAMARAADQPDYRRRKPAQSDERILQEGLRKKEARQPLRDDEIHEVIGAVLGDLFK